MLKEYFFESLVLLSRILCVDYKIMYIRFRMESKIDYLNDSENITNAQKDVFRKYFAQDYAIYDHFNRTFWRKVETFGFAKMKAEKAKIQNVYRKCNLDPDYCKFTIKPQQRRKTNFINPGTPSQLVSTMADAKGEF